MSSLALTDASAFRAGEVAVPALHRRKAAPVSGAGLQFAVGGFLAICGCLMLTDEHQFAGPAYANFQQTLDFWGAAFFFVGAALIASAFTGRRELVTSAHLLGGLLLCAWAGILVRSGGWVGVASYGSLGLGTLSAPLTGRLQLSRDTPLSWFSAVMGAGSAAAGAIILAFPAQLSGPLFAPLQAQLAWYGVSYLVTGLAVVLAQAWNDCPKPILRLCHLALAISMMSIGRPYIFVPVWTGVIYSWGLGVAVAAIPWLPSSFSSDRLRTLHWRLSAAFAFIAALPLLGLTLWFDSSEQQAAIQRGLQNEQAVAQSLAGTLQAYVDMYASAIQLTAQQPGLISAPASQQRATLRAVVAAFPEFTALELSSADGTPLARSDDQPGAVTQDGEAFDQLRGRRAPIVTSLASSPNGEPAIGFDAPVLDSGGRLVGFVGGVLQTQRIQRLLGQAPVGSAVFVVNEAGADVVQPRLGGSAAVHNQALQAALQSGGSSGSVEYGAGSQGELVGFARTPSNLNWTVLVQRPAQSELTSFFMAQDIAFGTLLLAILLSGLLGVWVADRIARPVTAFSDAAALIATEQVDVPLPASGILEIQRLSKALAGMQEQLHAKNAQRQLALDQEREARLDVEAQRQKLARMIELNPAAVLIVDAEGRPELFNAAMEELVGKPLAGRHPFVDLVAVASPDGRELSSDDRPLSRALLRGEAVRGERVTLRTDGGAGQVPVLTSAAPIRDPDGRIIGAVMACQDISAIDRLEAERNTFIENVVHDLKTPLTAVKGHAQLVRRRFDRGSGVTAATIESLAAIDQGVERATLMLDEMLDLAHLRAGHPLDLRQESVDLLPPLRRLIEERRDADPQHHFLFDARVGSVVGFFDRARLERAINNLLDNAAKYSAPGSDITLRVSGLQDSSDATACIRVEDQGIGIPQEDASHIFERFHRGSNVAGVAGAGIGLAGVKEIVEKHGGGITVESRLGTGSTFIITLPLRRTRR